MWMFFIRFDFDRTRLGSGSFEIESGIVRPEFVRLGRLKNLHTAKNERINTI